ncbi:transposase [Gelidibacter pelagius]|uniref:transposase n=1 Tax=Gelidibacter pelagius TaxID=2819985 RepID=UPI001F47B4DD|nr:transposase [Gelidibacter pelagius]
MRHLGLQQHILNDINPLSNILNYFDVRSANASAESFNAMIEAFGVQFGVIMSVEFFLIMD